MKLLLTALLCFTCLFHANFALKLENYTAFIEELMHDEKFLDEYAKWSFQLFSQPDYLYGDLNKTFPCPATKDTNVPTSVHQLRPSDIKCVGAMGDSLTAALGAHAITPVGLFFENRGLSWSVGGDHTFNKVLSVPNTLRNYDEQLIGYSTKVSVIFLKGQDAKNNHMNVAESGDVSDDMPYQAELLINRTKKESTCDWNNDWKMVTLFVGGNDLCSFCEEPNGIGNTPEKFLANVRDALDKLYNAPMPRTLVNMVLVLDVRQVQQLNSGGFVCRTLHKRTCPCAAFPTDDQAKALSDYIPRYHQLISDLVSSGRYDGRDDFTVVVQPFMSKTQLPYKPDHSIDFSYFAPDCFHFSGKGHAQAALSLWNNMLEPVGAKQEFWHMGEQLRCPSQQYPYIFTNKNSAQAVDDFKRAAAASSTRTTEPTTGAPEPTTFTSGGSSSSTAGLSTKKHKHHKSDSDEIETYHFAFFAGLFFLVFILLIVAVTRRQQIRVFIQGTGQRHLNSFVNPPYTDDIQEDDIYIRTNDKRKLPMHNNIPSTHGTRINFE